MTGRVRYERAVVPRAVSWTRWAHWLFQCGTGGVAVCGCQNGRQSLDGYEEEQHGGGKRYLSKFMSMVARLLN